MGLSDVLKRIKWKYFMRMNIKSEQIRKVIMNIIYWYNPFSYSLNVTLKRELVSAFARKIYQLILSVTTLQ